MKILETQSAHITNAEVLIHLNDIAARRRKAHPAGYFAVLKSPNFETVVKELTSYLVPAPSSTTTGLGPPAAAAAAAGPIPDYNASYNATTIRRVVERLDKFKLTKPEVMMILNLRPGSPVELDPIVEECDARLTAEQQEEVLRIISAELGGGGPPGDDGEGDGDEDEDGDGDVSMV